MSFFRIRGLRLWDTLALWVNALFWLPRRTYYRWRYRDKKKAWRALMQKPHRHWMVWPFNLEGRFYRWPNPLLWVDAQGLSWLMGGQSDSFPAAWLAERLSKSQIGMDIGAHRGYWVLAHAPAFAPQTKVLLIEPDPNNFSYLLQNLALNRAFWYTLPLPLALWNAPGFLPLRAPAQDRLSLYSSYLLRVEPAFQGEETFRVPVTTIDALVLLLGLERVEWIKIDAEGAEVAILQGARQTLDRFSPSLWIEVHDTWDQLLALLQELGYTVRDQVRLEDPEAPYPSYGYLWAEKASPPAIS